MGPLVGEGFSEMQLTVYQQVRFKVKSLRGYGAGVVGVKSAGCSLPQLKGPRARRFKRARAVQKLQGMRCE